MGNILLALLLALSLVGNADARDRRVPIAAAGGGGGGTVTFDTAKGAFSTSGTTTDTGAFTVAAGSNLALVCTGSTDVTAITSVTGVTFTAGSASGSWTQQGTIYTNGDRKFDTWYVTGPATGSTNVRFTWDGTISGGDGAVVCMALQGVDQTTPLDSCQDVASSTVTMNATLSSGGMVFALLQAPGNPGAIVTGTEDYAAVNNEFWRFGHNSASGTVAWTTAAQGRGMRGCNVRAQ